jgi:hypothetical protein
MFVGLLLEEMPRKIAKVAVPTMMLANEYASFFQRGTTAAPPRHIAGRELYALPSPVGCVVRYSELMLLWARHAA